MKFKYIKIVPIALIALLFTYAVVSLADDMIQAKTEKQTIALQEEKVKLHQKRKEQTPMVDEEVKDRLNKNIIDNSMLEILQNQKLDEDEIQLAMEAYARLIVTFSPIDEDIDFIKGLIQKGYDLRKICNLYTFLADGDIDLQLLQLIYDEGKSIDFEGESWIEDAFDTVTGRNDDVSIQSYLNKNLTLQEINIANAISRRGKLTKKEILDKRVEGIEWIDIFMTVYDDLNIDRATFEVEKNPNVIFNSIQIARNLNQNINSLYKDTNGNPLDAYSENIAPKLKKMHEYLKENNLKHTYYNDAITKAKQGLEEKGLNEKKINELAFKGYTAKEIEKAADISLREKTTVDDVLELYKKENKWLNTKKAGENK